jgi:hypothetical protein
MHICCLKVGYNKILILLFGSFSGPSGDDIDQKVIIDDASLLQLASLIFKSGLR